MSVTRALLITGLLFPCAALAGPAPETELPPVERVFELLAQERDWAARQLLKGRESANVAAKARGVLRSGLEKNDLLGAAIYLSQNGAEEFAQTTLRERLAERGMPPALRGVLAESLGAVGSPQGREVLEEILEGEEGPALHGAARGLTRVRDSAALGEVFDLAVALQGEDPLRFDVLCAALEEAAKGPRGALLAEAAAALDLPAELLRVLRHARSADAWEAVRSVARAAVEAEDPACRAVGLELLVSSRDPEASEFLVEGLYDEASQVRLAAIEGVELADLQDALPYCIALVGDDSLEVRRAAHAAAQAMSGHELPRIRSRWEQWYKSEQKRLRFPKGPMPSLPSAAGEALRYGASEDFVAEAVEASAPSAKPSQTTTSESSLAWELGIALVAMLIAVGAPLTWVLRDIPKPVERSAADSSIREQLYQFDEAPVEDPKGPSAWTLRLRRLITTGEVQMHEA